MTPKTFRRRLIEGRGANGGVLGENTAMATSDSNDFPIQFVRDRPVRLSRNSNPLYNIKFTRAGGKRNLKSTLPPRRVPKITPTFRQAIVDFLSNTVERPAKFVDPGKKSGAVSINFLKAVLLLKLRSLNLQGSKSVTSADLSRSLKWPSVNSLMTRLRTINTKKNPAISGGPSQVPPPPVDQVVRSGSSPPGAAADSRIDQQSLPSGSSSIQEIEIRSDTRVIDFVDLEEHTDDMKAVPEPKAGPSSVSRASSSKEEAAGSISIQEIASRSNPRVYVIDMFDLDETTVDIQAVSKPKAGLSSLARAFLSRGEVAGSSMKMTRSSNDSSGADQQPQSQQQRSLIPNFPNELYDQPQVREFVRSVRIPSQYILQLYKEMISNQGIDHHSFQVFQDLNTWIEALSTASQNE